MVLIFDIDGTLVTKKRSRATYKQTAFTLAVETIFGQTDVSYMDYPVFGKTDRGIYQMVMRALNVSERETEEREQEFLKKFKEIYQQLSLQGEPEYVPLPGVVNLLGELKNKKALMGIATGNLEIIARQKLKDAGILSFFTFGAYGETSRDRSDIVKKALNEVSDDNPKVLFGDTPEDIRAAHNAGISVIAVATGRFSKQTLTRYVFEKDMVVEDFSEIDPVLHYLQHL